MNCLDTFLRKLGEADIEIGAVRLWIHKRQLPDATDFWNANWVEATVHCEIPGASVWTTGAFLHLTEIQAWLETCRAGYQTLVGDISLVTLEPDLQLNPIINSTGKIAARVEIRSGT